MVFDSAEAATVFATQYGDINTTLRGGPFQVVLDPGGGLAALRRSFGNPVLSSSTEDSETDANGAKKEYGSHRTVGAKHMKKGHGKKMKFQGFVLAKGEKPKPALIASALKEIETKKQGWVTVNDGHGQTGLSAGGVCP